jgi:CRP/FNR family cyclic AMP-dependent transcriptional regulator
MTASSPPGAERTLQFLKNSTFYGGLPETVLDTLVRRGHVRKYAKGEVVYQSGDAGDSLMVILSGRLKISNMTASGREVVLNFLGAGDISGEIAALDGRERSATAIALEDSESFVIHRRDILPVLIGNPETMLEILQIVCEKLRTASAIVEANLLEMTARLAHGLLRLADQHGRVTRDGIVIDLQLIQRDLGSYVGLSRENVSRQLGKLKREGLIRMAGSSICIADREALSEIADRGDEAGGLEE